MNCRYCGRYGGDCSIAVCSGCGIPVCHGYGSARGCCPVCLYGMLPGWHFPVTTCGYKHCKNNAVYYGVPRVKRCCKKCAETRCYIGKGKKKERLSNYIKRCIRERGQQYMREI